VLALIIFNLLPILLLIIHLHICPLSCLERQRGSWAGSASNHKFVVWSSLLNQRSTQQEISVGRRRRPADACGAHYMAAWVQLIYSAPVNAPVDRLERSRYE
jgi:hypothetical protein